jgi:hypothetical protein
MEIWRPVSVTRAPGHTRVRVSPCLEPCEGGIYRFRTFIATHMETLSPAPGLFYGHGGQIRYMNGRGEVYETNIVDPIRVLFVPDGQQHVSRSWEPVMFRKLHKVEWLFE